MKTPLTSPAARRLTHAFASDHDTLHLPLDHRTSYVLFSDCHRGIGNANDNFLKNEYLYLAALNYYYRKKFIYIELGDGDELWENRSFSKIKETHPDSFRAIARFYADQRFYTLYGNHDMIKKNPVFCRIHFDSCYCDCTLCSQPLCPGIHFYESIILHNTLHGKDIFLTHGHQAELLNSTLWKFARFLVRYFWQPLEWLGIPDPTSSAKNNSRKKRTEQTLNDWARTNDCILITGHTHRPMIFSNSEIEPYLNTGSCVHPSGITCMEITGNRISLVKWSMTADPDRILRAERQVLGDASF